MTKLTSDFGAQVKAMRERLQLIQEALAESLGVSFATLSRWENGWTVPSKLAVRQIDLLCKEHHIDSLIEIKHSARSPQHVIIDVHREDPGLMARPVRRTRRNPNPPSTYVDEHHEV